MIKDNNKYSILIIEDNPGDLMIFEEYLKEHIFDPKLLNASNYSEAESIITTKSSDLDIVFLDLSLPDKKGEDLINNIVKLCQNIPIVVLTGYTDIHFSVKSLHLGISDYLLKDEIVSLTLYKSLRYNIERFKYIAQLEESEKRYMDLFHYSPQPMWIYDIETLKFLEVNISALDLYGYSYDEFLKMTLESITPESEFDTMLETVNNTKDDVSRKFIGVFNHKKKNGEIITVEARSNQIHYSGKKVRIVLVIDITEQLNYVKAIINQNKSLKEIAWIQSHVVRAPLARMMGLIDVIKSNKEESINNKDFIIDKLLSSAEELDVIIKDISKKASNIEVN
ncbi:PAS domain S-box protein [Cellulophaga sp. HaHaR_3_176]|uniref:PAS domain S-box protein n=1 Tax=Cellulophaga sp. HaHaR_3_176 TaxID=1942464 RepID=UPI001C1F3733|nr:PAS domain S-box protein [Cellulophaga sp. HaHaR_3_176]QWX83963.1 PAS domain S-box protein [Cellulophaga sp. HaHaR_3_176]